MASVLIRVSSPPFSIVVEFSSGVVCRKKMGEKKGVVLAVVLKLDFVGKSSTVGCS